MPSRHTLRPLILAVLAVLGVAVLTACDAQPTAPQPAPPPAPTQSTYSFVASLQLHTAGHVGEHQCSGALVGVDWVLTAGHCVTEPPPEIAAQMPKSAFDHADKAVWQVRIGSADRRRGGQLRLVKAILAAPTWRWGYLDSQGRFADLALLRLDRPVVGLAPIRIAPLDPAKGVRILQWGTTDSDVTSDAQIHRILQQQDSALADQTLCRKGPIVVGELCLSMPAQGREACQGASGGPRVQALTGRGVQWVLVAVSSRSSARDVPCAQTAEVVTEAASFLDWITQTMAAA